MSDKISPESARAQLVELIFGCPRWDASEDCLLYDKRQLSLSNKLGWAMSLPDDELVHIYSAHCECLKAKIS